MISPDEQRPAPFFVSQYKSRSTKIIHYKNQKLMDEQQTNIPPASEQQNVTNAIEETDVNKTFTAEEEEYEEEYTRNDLNEFTVAILWISLVMNSLSLLFFIFQRGEGSISPMAEALIAILSLLGTILLLHVRKTGFFLMVGARLLMIVIAYFEARQLIESGSEILSGHNVTLGGLMTQPLITNLGQILFLCFILSLKKNGKSGFEVLWRK